MRAPISNFNLAEFMSEKQSLHKRILSYVLTFCTGAAGWILLQLQGETWKPFLDNLLPAASRSWLILLLLLSIVANVALLSWLLLVSKRDIKDDFELVGSRGFYRHKKRTSEFYCGACLAVDRITPLAATSYNIASKHVPGIFWECHFPDCKHSYDRKQDEK
jgi:hypothetical protein